ncbi:putative F-box domain-containing protein [Medicago truncatula]|uniref:Putative F-box domain-containing protein n=1 Tax=Medicago truncatula TaxID=3880 RepID=A0A396J311_MEDTR|nr:putative F-box domain-containing protein [Medicago truncatula]
MAVVTRSQRRMMEEATAESPSSVLPEDLMIEILSRVESNNPLELRCVCKLWNSLILDSQFMMNHLDRLYTEMTVLYAKAMEHLMAFKSQHIVNNPVIPQEQEHDDDDDDVEDDEETDEEDDNEEAAVEQEEQKEEKQVTMNELVQMDNVDEVDKEKQLAKDVVAQLDYQLEMLRFVREDVETKKINIDMQPNIDLEDRMTYLRSFIRIYLKSTTT